MLYRKEIDGLRAIAVLPVIFFHAGFDWFSGGFVGVDVFFVISGYLITSIIFSEIKTGQFSIIAFYERRCRRILPALFFVILVCLPFAWLWMLPNTLLDFSKSLISVMLYVSNLYFRNDTGYFANVAEEKPLLHTWSLSVEEQYYLFFPLLTIFFWRIDKKWLPSVFILIAMISFIFAELQSVVDPQKIFFDTRGRAGELLIGSFIAIYLNSQKEAQHLSFSSGINQLGSAIGFALIVLPVFLFNKTIPYPGFYTLIPTLGAAFIILFASPQTAIGKLLSQKWLVGVGLISYSAYLWHQPLFAFARLRSLDQPSQLLFIMLIVSTIVLAWFSWKYIESPFRDKYKISTKSIFFLTSLMSAMFVSLGALSAYNKGFQYRFNKQQKDLIDSIEYSPKRNKCHTGGENFKLPNDACTYGGPNITWAVLGNSFGVEVGYSLSKLLKPNNEGLIHLTFSACVPSMEIEDASVTKGCHQWTQKAIERIVRDKQIKNVLLAYSQNSFYDQDQRFLRMANYIASYIKIIDVLLNEGKKVFVLYPVPRLNSHVEKYIFFAKSPSSVVSIQKSDYLMENQFLIEQLEHFDWNDNLIALDPAEKLCHKINCYAVINNKAMYFDKFHLSVSGADLVLTSLKSHLN
ncbi:acyltransferase family protein [Methylobacter sp.]|uniref:acyltransferase family protein n=1 Tax=Methylobacter sp. TaxID=2051955 RepID=UPI003DA30323